MRKMDPSAAGESSSVIGGVRGSCFGGMILSYTGNQISGSDFAASAKTGARNWRSPRHSAAKPLPNAAKKICILVLHCASTCNNEGTEEKPGNPLFMRIKGMSWEGLEPATSAFSLRW